MNNFALPKTDDSALRDASVRFLNFDNIWSRTISKQGSERPSVLVSPYENLLILNSCICCFRWVSREKQALTYLLTSTAQGVFSHFIFKWFLSVYLASALTCMTR